MNQMKSRDVNDVQIAEREDKVRRWFAMWLDGENTGIDTLFARDAVYAESWGPEYHGSAAIAHWFEEWNTRGKVLVWDIRQFFHGENQTVVEWFFSNRMKDGVDEAFEGMSLIGWTRDGQIQSLKEYGCNIRRYDPYEDGPKPRFRDEKAMWF